MSAKCAAPAPPRAAPQAHRPRRSAQAKGRRQCPRQGDRACASQRRGCQRCQGRGELPAAAAVCVWQRAERGRGQRAHLVAREGRRQPQAAARLHEVASCPLPAQRPRAPRAQHPRLARSPEMGVIRPRALLPFPPEIVGTYSCHGVEPGMRVGETSAKINQDRGCVCFPFGPEKEKDQPVMALLCVFDGHGDRLPPTARVGHHCSHPAPLPSARVLNSTPRRQAPAATRSRTTP